MALAKAGFLPVAYDNLSRGHHWAVRWGPLEVHELKDKAALRGVLRKYKPVAVLHFAAFAYVGESMRAPDLYFQNNLVNSLTLLDAMRDCDVATIVFSSSCATYGLPIDLPIPESHPQNPISPYGESKRAVEQALRWHGAAYGIKWAALRYFNAAGADPKGEIGEDHRPETHLIPLAIEAALGLRPHVSIFGTDYPTSDGTAIRDFIHVMDLAEAHVRALEYLLEGGASRALNLGTGQGHSVRKVIQTVERATAARSISRHAERRAGDPPELVADARAANRVLDWQPSRSDLETIVRTALDWHRFRRPAADPPAGSSEAEAAKIKVSV
jgi:UDP-glucose-4-epimerase GalE